MLKVFGIEPWQTESTHHFYYGQLLPVLQDFFKSTVPLDTVIALLENMAKIAGLPQLTLYSIPSMMAEIADCDIDLFKGHRYNDIDVERIARLIKFAVDNFVPEKLEGSQYRAFKEGFAELFPEQE
jgi:NTE family protein